MHGSGSTPLQPGGVPVSVCLARPVTEDSPPDAFEIIHAPDDAQEPHDAGDDVPEGLGEVNVRLLEKGRSHRHPAAASASSMMAVAHGAG